MTSIQAIPASPGSCATPQTLRAQAMRLFRKGSWGIADQMLISATNFITMVLLARGLGPAAFGAFSLVYGGMLFVNSLQGALILQPHSVLSAGRKGRDYADYTASTGVSQLLFAGIAALLSVAAGLFSAVVGWPTVHLFLALAPCIVAWQLHEFVRRVLYNETRFRAAFVNDVVSYGGQTLAIAGLWAAGALTAPVALYAIAAASAVAAAFGVWQLRSSLAGRLSPSVFSENWTFGKWLAGAEIGYWASSQLYLYLTGIMLGAAASGVLRAGYVIFGPTRILGFFLRSFLPNQFARTLVSGGKAAMHEQVKVVWTVIAPLMAAYCLLVAVFADPLVRLLYGEAFAGHATVVVLYALFAFVALMTSVLTSALRAKQLARHLFTSQVYATLVAVPVGWVLIKVWGVEGAVVGMIATNLVVGLSNYLAYRRDQAYAAPAEATAVDDDAVETAEAAAQDQAAPAAGRPLRRVFERLDETETPYCVLHGYEALPDRVCGDMDCLMPSDLLPHRLATLLRGNEQHLGARVVQWFQDAAHFIVLAGREPGGPPFFLQLHACGDYEVGQRRLYSGADVLLGRRRHDGFWVPEPAVEFSSYLARKIAKGRLRDDHERRLSDLYRQDPDGCRSQAVRLWGADKGNLIADAAAAADWGPVQVQLLALRGAQNWRALRARPTTFVTNCAAAAWRRVRRWWLADRGLDVVLLGPDGAGKSSVVDALRQDLAPAFVGTQRRSFPPALLRRGSGTTNSTPHAQRPRSFLNSSVRAVCYWFAYCTLSHFTSTRRARARGTLVLHDRHLVDALVDPRRYRYGGPLWLLRGIWRLVPKPDLIILLDAPVEVIQARKQEVPAEETRRQVAEYRALACQLDNCHAVDAARPLREVVGDVEDVILNHLALRAGRQLGLEAKS